MVLFSWEDKGAHTFPKGICPKVNVIAQLGFELAFYCNIMAEGFRFMPLGLVRLRTFRLSTTTVLLEG